MKTVQDIFQSELGDARLLTISWIDHDLVLELSLSVMDPSVKNLRLHCKSVSELRLDLNFGDLTGSPLLWSASAHQLDSGIWEVLLDFAGAPQGQIEFECIEISASRIDLN